MPPGNETSGQIILTKSRIVGGGFFYGGQCDMADQSAGFEQAAALPSAAVVALMPLLIFWCIPPLTPKAFSWLDNPENCPFL